jgi:hypothetical protein
MATFVPGGKAYLYPFKYVSQLRSVEVLERTTPNVALESNSDHLSMASYFNHIIIALAILRETLRNKYERFPSR